MANTNSHGFSKLQVLVMYKECLRNHASAAGVRSLDGCGLFEASGPIGDPTAMVCAACHCHRNFHRRIQIDLPLRDQTQAVDNVVSSQQHHPMPIPAPVPQPQVHQQPTPMSHARPPVPGPEITDLPPRPQVHRQASTGLAPSAAPSPTGGGPNMKSTGCDDHSRRTDNSIDCQKKKKNTFRNLRPLDHIMSFERK